MTDPLLLFLGGCAQSSQRLFASEDVQATLYTLSDGTQLVLKATGPERADYEWQQLANEVKAAKSLPAASCLGQQLAWKEAADGSSLSVSLYAGPTVEALLQQPSTRGGWADLPLWQRVEVARDLLAGGVHALMRMRPWLHFDVKPANMCVLPCPAGGPPHITLLDMGAATHIAALRAPQRSTLYPVVSMDHMDVALLTMQPGQDQLPYETKQGCREALSHGTDVFTLGLLAYKVLLGPNLPPEMDWDSAMYQPGGPHMEQRYVAEQQRLARDLAAGISSHPGTAALLRQLPQDCLTALGAMCDPDPVRRVQLQDLPGLGFIQHRLTQLGLFTAARDAAHAAARQSVINLLQDVPGIQLAARPSRVSDSAGGAVGGTAKPSSGSNCSSGITTSWLQLEAECAPPPGAFTRLPRGTNAAREAAAAAANQAAQQHLQNQSNPHQHQQQQQRQQAHPSGAYAECAERPPGFNSQQGSSYRHAYGATSVDQEHNSSSALGQQQSGSSSRMSAQHNNLLQQQEYQPPAMRSRVPTAGFQQHQVSTALNNSADGWGGSSDAAAAAGMLLKHAQPPPQPQLQQEGEFWGSPQPQAAVPKPAQQQWGCEGLWGVSHLQHLSGEHSNGWGAPTQHMQQQQQQQGEFWGKAPASPAAPGVTQRQHGWGDDGQVHRDQQPDEAQQPSAAEAPSGSWGSHPQPGWQQLPPPTCSSAAQDGWGVQEQSEPAWALRQQQQPATATASAAANTWALECAQRDALSDFW